MSAQRKDREGRKGLPLTPEAVFARSCGDYYTAGWPCVIPVPPGTKYPPPGGFTGAEGADTPPEQLVAWAGSHAGWSVALRMPDGIIGIDIDQYVKAGTAKDGAATLAARTAQWGPLPATWSSTARGTDEGPGESRVLFFRVPPGRYAAQLGPDAEVLQRHHRYAVVAPSPHPDGGRYRWYGPDGSPADRVPAPGELAWLPGAWVAGLAEGAASASPVAGPREAGQALLAELAAEDGLRCIAVTTAVTEALAQCEEGDPGSRHDLMTRHAYHIVQLGAEGHPGCGSALGDLRAAWARMMAAEPGRLAELDGMLLTAARKAVTRAGARRGTQDPCTGMFGLGYETVPAPAPAGLAGSAPDGTQPPVMPERPWSPYMAIGTHEFAPVALADAFLARDVLERTQRALRYCPDAGAWIVRGPEHWSVRKGELAKWGVDLMWPLMQPGDPEAPDGSLAKIQAARRAKFTMNAASAGIAGKMAAQVAAGYHPCAVELADLDQDHEILWAGGMAYDLRACADGPAFAPVDTGIPHLHSAGVTPEARPTPLWDAFLAAVWPDPAVRAWALRVLAVTLTGYSDKALPILLGPTNRGKTQVIALLMSVLGSYAHAADPRLLSPADRSHASIVYALKGRRCSFIDEAPKSGQQAQERLKQLTGGAELTGNRMAENPISFLPTHTLILTANPESEPRLTDGAVRSRVRLIPCEGDPEAVRAARAAIGPVTSAAWRAEAPGVLAMMMAQAALWLADPGSASTERGPLAVQEAADATAAAQDLPYGWLTEECEHWEAGTKANQLYQEFVSWCRRVNIQPHEIPKVTAWGLRLNELGYPPEKRRDANYRKLRVRLAGYSGGTPPRVPGSEEASVEGWVEGCGGSAGQPSTPQNARSNYPQLSTVEGVDTPLPFIRTHTHAPAYVHTRAPAHTHTQDMQFGAHNPPPIHEPEFPQVSEVDPAGIPSTAPSATPPQCPQAPSTTAEGAVEASTAAGGSPAAVAVTGSDQDPALPPGPGKPPLRARRLTRQELADGGAPPEARKPRARKPSRLEGDPSLAGPRHPLPVLVIRDPADPGRPLVAPCSPGDARAAVERYLGALCVDCETTGFPVGHRDYALRTVQLGGEPLAAVLDPGEPAQAAVISDLLERATALHAHSAAADLVPLARAGLAAREALWAKMTDSVLKVKLADPALAGSDESQLKKLAGDLLGGYAVSPPAERAKNELFKAGGWLVSTTALTPAARSGWAQADPGCEVMARYAGSDVLDLAAVLRVLPEPDAAVLAREREFQVMCARVAHDGFRLDPAHIAAKAAEHEAAREACRERVSRLCPAITNPSSPKEVPAALEALGVPLGTSRVTGRPSAAKAELERLAADGSYSHHELLSQILAYRHHVTTLGLLLEPLSVLCAHGDGRMRPVVYTINADTGRTSCVRPNGQQFCYSSSMDILTDQGWKAFPDVSVTDRVAQWRDGLIEFVYPEAVLHEAYDGPMIKISGEHHEQVVTPNHRVYSLTRRGQLMIERADSWLVHGAVGKVVDRKLIRGGRLVGRKLTNQERLSLYRAVAIQADGHFRDDCAFVHLAFTKERKADRAAQLGLEVRLSDQERGGKRVYVAKAYGDDFKPWLNLPDKTFNIPALLELCSEDLEGFLGEVMIWDGDATRRAAYNQAMSRREAVDAVELAAVLSGNSTCRSVKRVAGRDYACVQVFPKAERWASRTNVTEVPSDGMIHCVTVPSGAVVVRSPSGKVGVSGNSRQGGIRACVIADPGMMGISADFSGVEIRVAAALSGDMDLLAAELEGSDHDSCADHRHGLHWMAAKMAWGAGATKENRYAAKRIIFSKLFGGSAKAGARQTGVPYEAALAVHQAFEAIAPRYAAWDAEMRAYAGAGNRGYQAYSGRTIWLPRGRAHAAGNYAIQGTARELLVDGALRWHKTRWGKLPMLPIHDELLTWVPAGEAHEALETLKACMRTTLHGVPIEAAADEPFLAWPDSS